MSENDFTKEFISCLQVPLIHGEKHRAVENALNFASKFIASLLQPKPAIQSDEEDEEEICPFVLNVLKFLFEVSLSLLLRFFHLYFHRSLSFYCCSLSFVLESSH